MENARCIETAIDEKILYGFYFLFFIVLSNFSNFF